ncbi:MAG: hypothetical protein Barrevirus9_12 [Barrevirus sp.]|uniref:Uncharacterized protein n=1 Tax=Barrevirus sp. TaxID=2487763 RepID=A0A3G4ZTX2_9VIRU|nr:MAG: hypothetical protein Barrevirus9_12 [Barrevirus sp.]
MDQQYRFHHNENDIVKHINLAVKQICFQYRLHYDLCHIVNPFCDKGPGNHIE